MTRAALRLTSLPLSALNTPVIPGEEAAGSHSRPLWMSSEVITPNQTTACVTLRPEDLFLLLNDVNFRRKAAIQSGNSSDSECSSRQRKYPRVITIQKPHIRVMVCLAALLSAIGCNMINDHFVPHWRPEISPVSFGAQLRLKRRYAAFLVCHSVMAKDRREQPQPTWHVGLDQVTLLLLMKVTQWAEEGEEVEEDVGGRGRGGVG